MTTAIVGAQVVTSDRVAPLTIVISGEQVVELRPPDAGVGDADELIDAGGLVALPGAIDPHVHFGDPGQHEREDFFTGTAGAALGGITCVFEHPLTTPPTTTAARFADKRDDVGTRAVVDFGLWGAIVPGGLGEIAGQWEAGARGFKAFMCDSSGAGFPHADDASLLAGMREVARLGGLALVHAENDAIVAAGAAAARAAGAVGPLDHADARPPIAEHEAAARALLLAEEAGARLQIVHTSVAAVAALVDAAADRGVPVTLEHTAHHLLLDRADLERHGPYAKCAPPIRAREQVEALWARIADGRPAQLGCDHSPYARAEKARGADDVFEAGTGIQSIRESVPLVLDEAIHRRGLDLPACARLIAGDAAAAIGLAGRKGAIAPGLDADVALWDLDRPWTVDAARQQRSPSPWSPFEGRACRVAPVRTILRGRTVALGGDLVAGPGSGAFVVPEAVG